MGLEKFVIKQISKVAKNTVKIDNSLASMKNKLIDGGIEVFDKAGINKSSLPFDVVALANGKIENPNNLLNPNNLCSTPPLTNSQKKSAAKAVKDFNKQVLSIVKSSNNLKSALVQIQQPLIALTVTSQTLDAIITGVGVAVTVIKALPIPVAFGAPAIAIPLNVIMILSDSLDSLSKLLIGAKGITSAIPILVDAILEMLVKTIANLTLIISLVPPALISLSFIQSKIDLGDSCPPIDKDKGWFYVKDNKPYIGDNHTLTNGKSYTGKNANDFNSALTISTNNGNIVVIGSYGNNGNGGTSLLADREIARNTSNDISQSDINNIQEILGKDIQDNLLLGDDPSITIGNVISEEELINSLQPNSPNPLIYKGFTLVLEDNPDNTFSFPQRRMVATRLFEIEGGHYFTKNIKNDPLSGPVIIYNDPITTGGWSFSASTEVLIEETYYKIDLFTFGLQEMIPFDEVSVGREVTTTTGTASASIIALDTAVTDIAVSGWYQIA